MNKKLNTLFFFFFSTLFNVIVAVVSFFVFFVFYAKVIMHRIPESSYSWGFTLIFLASIAVSIAVYRVVLKYLLKKVEIEKYFDPIFVSKYRKKRNETG
jgi:hypothetical protein